MSYHTGCHIIQGVISDDDSDDNYDIHSDDDSENNDSDNDDNHDLQNSGCSGPVGLICYKKRPPS